MKYSISHVALATLFASMPMAAMAQETNNSDTIIVTASRVPLEAREVGSALSILDSDAIKAGQVLFVKNAFQDLPGMQISNDRPGAQTTVSVRGSEADQVLFLMDGMELGDPSLITTQFQSENLTSLDIARVEVLRGNQSSLYGADAIGGVVNIITQRATEDGYKANAELEGGSFGTISGGASVFGKNGPFDFRLSATGYSADGPSVADPETGPAREKDSYSRWSLSGRAGYQIADEIEAEVMGFYNDASADLDNTNSDNADYVDKTEGALGVKLAHKTQDGKWGNTLSVSRYDVERLYFGSFNLPQGDKYEGTKDSVGYTLNFNPFDYLGFAAGASYEKESTDQLTNFGGAFEEKIDTKSMFSEIALRPLEGLSLTAAARLDDNSRFGEFDTYRVTAAYVLPNQIAGGSVKLRASYGTGAKSPGLYQLFDPTYGNATLTTAESKGYDAGVDIDWEKAHLQVTLFQNKVTNEIDFDFAGGRFGFGGYVNRGETETKGLEVGGDYQFFDWLGVSQSLTVLDADDGVTGQWLGRPRYSGSTSVTVTPAEQWSVTARARYRSRNASSAFSPATDGFVTVDLLGAYQLNEHIELYGRVVNVADEFYQLSYGANTGGRAGYVGVRARF